MSLKIVVSLPPDPKPLKLDNHGRAKNLKLTTTLINTGDDRLTLVNDPSSVLSEHAQFQKFIVASTSEDRENPRFKGLRLTFSPEIAAERGNVTSLDAGLSASLTRTHDLSGVYTFTPGEYSFEPGRIFYAVDSTTHELQSIEAEVEPESFVINVSSAPDLPVDTSKAKKAKSASQAMEEISVSPRTIHRVFTEKANAPAATRMAAGSETPVMEPEFLGITNYERQIQLISVTQRAEECINEAIGYLEKMPSDSGTLRYEMWFGKYDKQRKEFVQSCFKIMRASLSSFSYDVGDDQGAGVIAYVMCRDDSFNTLFLTESYWDMPLTGGESKVDVIVSELVFTTQEPIYGHAYGVGPTKILAAKAPEIAVLNADSYAFFALNRPWYG